MGQNALSENVLGGSNVAVGFSALRKATGENNIAIGTSAATNLVAGDRNIIIGNAAGQALDAGSNNIYLGHDGSTSESNVIRIGTAQTKAFIRGIRGTTTGTNDAVAVLIDSNGQLGTVSSSRRYKTDIATMGTASAGLLRLRPVTFRYRQPYEDGSTPRQYGLIAEEVAEVYPNLLVYDDTGRPETVQYRKVNAMLLNEVQRQHRQIEALTARLSEVERRLETN